jgi:hypothetical protein
VTSFGELGSLLIAVGCHGDFLIDYDAWVMIDGEN